MKRLSRAGEWAVAIAVGMVLLVWMLGNSTSGDGWAHQRLEMAKELCGVPGRHGVDMNLSTYYMKRNTQARPGEVSLSEKWAWYLSQLDGYTPAELRSAGCEEEAVELREQRAQAGEAARQSEAARQTSNTAAPRPDGGCTSDPRQVFAAGQRVSGAEIRRRLELHCAGSQLMGTMAVVVHKGVQLTVELEPLADDYYTVKRVGSRQ